MRWLCERLCRLWSSRLGGGWRILPISKDDDIGQGGWMDGWMDGGDVYLPARSMQTETSTSTRHDGDFAIESEDVFKVVQLDVYFG